MYIYNIYPTRAAYKSSSTLQQYSQIGELIAVQGDQLIYTRKLQKGEKVYTPGMEGFSNSAEDYHISIENRKTGAGVRITSDQPLLKLVY